MQTGISTREVVRWVPGHISRSRLLWKLGLQPLFGRVTSGHSPLPPPSPQTRHRRRSTIFYLLVFKTFTPAMLIDLHRQQCDEIARLRKRWRWPFSSESTTFCLQPTQRKWRQLTWPHRIEPFRNVARTENKRKVAKTKAFPNPSDHLYIFI